MTLMEYSGNFHFYRICSVKVLGLLVLSALNVQTCETWNYVEYSSPLVYSKFYSSDFNFITVWQIKS